jgi:hypothetical protein
MQFYVMELVYNRDHNTIAGGIWANPPSYDKECAVCGKAQALLDWPDEIEIELKRVGRAGFVEVLYNGPLAIFRQDVIDLWRSVGFTGFTIRPVHIKGLVKGKRKRSLPAEIPQYYQLVLTSEVALKWPPLMYRCPACGYAQYDFDQKTGWRVDISTWDGSDIFGIGRPAVVLCTRNVAEATLRAGFGKSIPFVRAEERDTWEDYNTHKWDIDEWHKMLEGYLIRMVEDL